MHYITRGQLREPAEFVLRRGIDFLLRFNGRKKVSSGWHLRESYRDFHVACAMRFDARDKLQRLCCLDASQFLPSHRPEIRQQDL
jgi:hypothetical protein